MSDLMPPVVGRFSAIIEQRLGLRFEDDKKDYLAEILRTRLQKSHSTGTGYLNQLELGTDTEEWMALSQLLTVPETYFFRHYDQFRAFADVALRNRAASLTETGRLSILSAGCASGEEAYSLAMMVRESGIDALGNVSICAADINAAVIDKAMTARYSAWSLRETPPDMLRKWFRPQGRDHVLNDAIRAAVKFECRNLTVDDATFWRPQSYDIIFCRNLMMYFSTQRAQALVARITKALAPGGYLFLGHAETLRGLSSDFHLCHTHDTFYYRRRGHDDVDAPAVEFGRPSQQPLFSLADSDSCESWVDTIRRSAERIQVLTTSQAIRPEKVQWDLGDALQLLHQERFAEALNVIRALPTEAAEDPETLLLKAVLHIHKGQLAEARQVCRQLLASDELHAGAQFVLALCHEEAGDIRAAVDHNQTAAYLDPNFAMPRLHLGLLARRAGNREAARRELEQASVLLQREEPSRLLLFGGGFSRDALLTLCHAELAACGGRP